MTLLETINAINAVAGSQPNINTIVRSGNVFDLNTDNCTVRYSAFCLQQEPHVQEGNFIDYRFTLFYVDRLMGDRRNKLEIHSTGIRVLQNIIRGLQELDAVDTSDEQITYTTFTERFASECAGVYCSVRVSSTVEVCYDELVEGLMGEFSDAFSPDFLIRK